jgi:serine/threonine protein kinase/formylglycine-generating enzyme required for sulfatase activity
MAGLWQVGSVIDGRFELLSILGEGGFGVVYEAKQRSTGQRVAVKLMLPSKLIGETRRASEITRFRREMELIGRLRHPHIVRLIDFGELDDGAIYYMVLEYIQGQSLAQRIRADGPLSPRLAAHLMSQVCDAMLYAHQQGVIHRDLKPQNIMITEAGFLPNATVLDFGIAGVVASARDEDYQAVTGTRDALGTPAYMSPEQISNQGVGPQSDLYAWGLVFAECLTGETVTSGTSLMHILMTQASRERVTLPAAVAACPLGPIVERATFKSLSARYDSAQSALKDLLAIPSTALSEQPIPQADGDSADLASPGAVVSADSFMETMGGPLEPTARDIARPPINAAVTDDATALLTSPSAPRPASTLAPGGVERPPASPDTTAHPAPSASPKALWVGVSVFALAVIASAWMLLSANPKPTPAATPAATPTTAAAVTAATTTPSPPDAAPDASTTPSADASTTTATPRVDPPTPAALAPVTVALPAAAVTLGLDATQRQALLTRFGNEFELDLSAETASIPRLTWQRPALVVMQGEVTWRQWRGWAGKLEPQTDCPSLAFPSQPTDAPDDSPATNVTPIEAQRLCESLGMRLPSAREWEAIARGPSDHLYGFSGDLSDDAITHLARQRRAQEIPWSRTTEGVFDLAGSASEWVTCGDDGLGYCLQGFASRGGAPTLSPFWFVSAVLNPPPPGVSSLRCYRAPHIGFRCVAPQP